MDVIIKEIAGTVRYTESDPLMDPEQFQRLVAAVLEAVEASSEREQRMAEARAVTRGSTDWLSGRGGS